MPALTLRYLASGIMTTINNSLKNAFANLVENTADHVAIYSQLENKVQITTSLSTDVTSFNNLPAGWCQVSSSITLSDAPVSGFNGHVLTSKLKTHHWQIAFHRSTGSDRIMFYRDWGSSSWSSWRQLVTTSDFAPNLTRHGVVMQNGYSSSPLGYTKDVAGWVHLNGLISKSTALAANEVIGSLPEGYRPKYTLSFPVCALNGWIGLMHITTSGGICWSASISSGYNFSNIALDVVFKA